MNFSTIPQFGAVPYAFEGTAKIGGQALNADVPFTIKGQLAQGQINAAYWAGPREK